MCLVHLLAVWLPCSSYWMQEMRRRRRKYVGCGRVCGVFVSCVECNGPLLQDAFARMTRLLYTSTHKAKKYLQIQSSLQRYSDATNKKWKCSNLKCLAGWGFTVLRRSTNKSHCHRYIKRLQKNTRTHTTPAHDTN